MKAWEVVKNLQEGNKMTQCYWGKDHYIYLEHSEFEGNYNLRDNTGEYREWDDILEDNVNWMVWDDHNFRQMWRVKFFKDNKQTHFLDIEADSPNDADVFATTKVIRNNNEIHNPFNPNRPSERISYDETRVGMVVGNRFEKVKRTKMQQGGWLEHDFMV